MKCQSIWSSVMWICPDSRFRKLQKQTWIQANPGSGSTSTSLIMASHYICMCPAICREETKLFVLCESETAGIRTLATRMATQSPNYSAIKSLLTSRTRAPIGTLVENSGEVSWTSSTIIALSWPPIRFTLSSYLFGRDKTIHALWVWGCNFGDSTAMIAAQSPNH